MWWEFGDDKNVLRFLSARDKFPMIDAFKITLLGGSLLLVIILFVRPLECKGVVPCTQGALRARGFWDVRVRNLLLFLHLLPVMTGSNASRDFISAVIPLWGEVCVRTQRRSDGPGSAAAPC